MTSKGQVSEAASFQGDTVILPFHSPARNGIGIHTNFYFDTLEHAALGNRLNLKIPNSNPSDGEPYKIWFTGTKGYTINASQWGAPFNTQNLTYGQINALAGDFYAASDPITGKIGENPPKATMRDRFMDAFNFMFQNPEAPAESQKILSTDHRIENIPYDEWKPKLKKLKKQPSWIFATQMESGKAQMDEFQALTQDRNWNGQDYPDYKTILLNNFDHFGQDALKAYAIGHEIALEEAVAAGKAKDLQHLWRAYALNAFAEHFLEDAFSAGHIRTPRRELHGDYEQTYDLCANLMHDEDGALGVRVRNKKDDQSWICFGDSYLHDDVAVVNKNKCHDALQQSAEEIWQAYHTGTYPADPDTYEAIQLAPIPINDPDPEYCAPLFIVKDGKLLERNFSTDDAKRSDWDISNYIVVDFWDSVTTYTDAQWSGWWKYKMSMQEKGTGN